MRLYEEIYIPCQDEDIEAIGMVSGPYVAEFPIKVHSKFDVIVLTIEEARALFQAGYDRSTDEWDGSFNQHSVNQPDFETYLKSKGIDIP